MSEFRVPIVVGGFEPVDLLEAILMLVEQLERGRAEVENQYVRSVSTRATCRRSRWSRAYSKCATENGAASAKFPQSGLQLRSEFAAHDAEQNFRLSATSTVEEPAECISARGAARA